MFVTCLFCIFEPAAGEMVMANAGHVPPYLVGDGSVMEIRARGFPLGMLPSTNYEEVSVRLPAGSTLLLSSDGILESHAPSGEMFGFARLLEAVSGPASAALVLSRVLATHRSFVGGGSEPEDDVTLVALGRL
jgi:sigma-B regulation protein RsbU (phosphoserine phosphatase)